MADKLALLCVSLIVMMAGALALVVSVVLEMWTVWRLEMSGAERLGWLLAVVCCVGLPLAVGEPGLAVVGAVGLMVLLWRLRRDLSN